MKIVAAISLGELVDKITILEIKLENIADESKLKNIRNELEELNTALASLKLDEMIMREYHERLKVVNAELWDIEDELRILESKKSFDDDFVELARSVYVTNDRRAAIKKEINLEFGSDFVEEKSYQSYD